jgi:hypothetical protein
MGFILTLMVLIAVVMVIIIISEIFLFLARVFWPIVEALFIAFVILLVICAIVH